MALDEIEAAAAERSLLGFRGPNAPTGAPAIGDDLLAGGQKLRRAFLETPIRYAPRDAALVRAGERNPAIILIRSGFAYRSFVLSDGRRTILDVLVPGDIAGFDNIVLAIPVAEITALSRVGCHALEQA